MAIRGWNLWKKDFKRKSKKTRFQPKKSNIQEKRKKTRPRKKVRNQDLYHTIAQEKKLVLRSYFFLLWIPTSSVLYRYLAKAAAQALESIPQPPSVRSFQEILFGILLNVCKWCPVIHARSAHVSWSSCPGRPMYRFLEYHLSFIHLIYCFHYPLKLPYIYTLCTSSILFEKSDHGTIFNPPSTYIGAHIGALWLYRFFMDSTWEIIR